MAWIFGKANDAEIATLKARGYDVSVGQLAGCEGFYGTEAEQAEDNDADKDILVYVDQDVTDVLT